MKIAIIGGAGKMGSFFAHYLEGRGHEILVIDPRAKSPGRKSSGISSVSRTDAVIVSVPMERADRVLREVRLHLKKNSRIIEISSLKSITKTIMRKIASEGHTAISLHPLFGPGVRGLRGSRMALIPVSNEMKEKKFVRSIFPEGSLVVVGLKEHERAMTSILSLTYFTNLLFASSLKKGEMKTLRLLAGTTFSVQLTLTEAVLNEDPSLSASILLMNPDVHRIAEQIAKKASLLSQLVRKGDRDRLISQLKDARKTLGDEESLDESYQKIYSIISKLNQ
ncbi:MAG: prephenate dehydrogenase/arogenate dehydrogenase family protein [Nitrososphaerales archaeon]